MIPIVFSTDHNYVMQTGVCILSLLKSATTANYEIYVIINDDVTEEDMNLLRMQVTMFSKHTLNFLRIGNVFDGAYETRGISTSAYSRLMIPWLLPHYDKVIYSDVDIIFKVDLISVFQENLDEYFLSACPAIGALTYYKEYVLKLKLNPDNYFNSGFLIINCKAQRHAHLKNKFLSEAKKSYIYQDQDIINIICKDRIKPVSVLYSLTPAYYERLVAGASCDGTFYITDEVKNGLINSDNCIIHYAGAKPWNTFTYGWNEWWSTYRSSIFYNGEYELEISSKILNPQYSWRKIFSIIKKKILS